MVSFLEESEPGKQILIRDFFLVKFWKFRQKLRVKNYENFLWIITFLNISFWVEIKIVHNIFAEIFIKNFDAFLW